MLNMRSTTAEARTTGERGLSPDDPGAPDERSTRTRIRDAAIACFADAGVAATPVRTIAAAADVSPALVIHHFGSKDALRVACDQHVAALVRQGKQEAMHAGPDLDPVGALRRQRAGPPVLAYLARTLVDGSPHVADLLDELVADAVEYTREGRTHRHPAPHRRSPWPRHGPDPVVPRGARAARARPAVARR
jgi:AcrR family transcriptional regulator